MAAQRVGSILSDVVGTANQILRVNAAETGFEFASPPSLPEYTITNDVTDRAYNANDTTVDELADVLATLVKDMESVYTGAGGGGLTAFRWPAAADPVDPDSWTLSSEEVWPFEKDENNNTLYCRTVNAGRQPNNGSKSMNLGLGELGNYVFRMEGFMGRTGTSDSTGANAPYVTANSSQWNIGISVDGVNLVIKNTQNYTSWDRNILRIIYTK